MQLQSFEFRFSLKFFNFILSIIHTVHKAFKSENANLADSIDLIQATFVKLIECRNEQKFLELYNSIDPTNSVKKRREVNLKLNDFTIESTIGFCENISYETLLTNLFYVVLDTLISELKVRFFKESFILAKACASLIKCNSHEIEPIIL